jgi:hypothetical protein
MRLRRHRRDLVVWSSSGRYGPPRPARAERFRRRLRTGVLLTVLGLLCLARTVRTRWRPALGLAGGVLTVAGLTLPNAGVLVSGLLALLFALLIGSDPGAAFACHAGRPPAAGGAAHPALSPARRPML